MKAIITDIREDDEWYWAKDQIIGKTVEYDEDKQYEDYTYEDGFRTLYCPEGVSVIGDMDEKAFIFFAVKIEPVQEVGK